MKFSTVLILGFACLARGAEVDFRREVLPILSDACFHCHGPDENKREADLRLDTREGLFKSEDGIPIVKPGDVKASELIARITDPDPDEAMPPKKAPRQLKPAEIETLKRWVAQGAPWGQHWAFAPMQKPAPPAQDVAPIDAFITAELRKHGIAALSPPADKERLLRRVSLDLTGLPPTVAEMDAFLGDGSANAYEKVVDRLLASARSAERLATEWLDVARYADTHGYQMDRFRPMWAYRDWVIKAFAKNLPYDQFVTEQLAGDLLPNATKDQRLATAFNRLHCQNEEGGIVEEEYRVAYVVDRVNTFATAFLGVTTECARCHDHKYDPISQRDFYQLFAFFQNVDEAGQTTYFTDSMPVPTVLLSTPEQDQKLTEMQAAIASAEANLATARKAAEADFAVWLDKLPEGPTEPNLDGEVARFAFESLEKGALNEVAGVPAGKAHEKPKLVAGKHGQAAELDGENGFTLPKLGHFTRSDPFTFGIWLHSPAPVPRAVIFHHSKAPVDAGSRGYELLLEDGRVAFGLHHMWPGNSLKVVTKAAVAANDWTHVAVTYDGSSRAAGVKVYVNGLAAPLEVVRDNLWKDITYGGAEPDLAIGYRFRDSGFKGGRVDDFRIFHRALTPLEAASLAGREDYREAVQAIPEISPAQRDALFAYYLTTTCDPAIEAVKQLHAARDAQRKFINPIPEAMAMQELAEAKPAFILDRGAYDARGAEVTSDTPAVLPPFPKDAPRNRLGLARWLLDAEHPLMARVTVNRYWQMMFGRGLVETTENFGTTGGTCSHPELLDWLARDFIAGGWDLKRLLKQMAMSATYRQATRPPLPTDPENILLSRAPARRLTAEMLRDSALAASGLLVEKLGGPSVKPYQPPGLWEEIAMGKPSYGQGKGADLYRRSLYTFWKRTVPPPAMATFDAADRSYCAVRRQSTSTPLQALALLNDVQIVEAARFLGQRMLREGGATVPEQVAWIYRTVTGRRPHDREVAILQKMYAEQRELFAKEPANAQQLAAFGESKADPALSPPDLAAAASTALALLNHDEALMRR